MKKARKTKRIEKPKSFIVFSCPKCRHKKVRISFFMRDEDGTFVGGKCESKKCGADLLFPHDDILAKLAEEEPVSFADMPVSPTAH